MKIKVLLGNFTFNHFVEEELKLFKTDSEQKALIHEIEEVKHFNTLKEAYKEVDNTHHLSWIIPQEFDGEIAFDKDYIIGILNDSFSNTRDNHYQMFSLEEFEDEYGSMDIDDVIKKIR